VKRVVAKMNGLVVKQFGGYLSMRDISTWGITPGQTTVSAGVLVETVMSPTDVYAMIGSLSATNDTKSYFKQHKKDYYIRNGGMPGWLKVIHFKCRKNVSFSDYTSIQNILADQAPSVNFWAGQLTTGNPAQKLLKFKKTKLIYLCQGGCTHLKLNHKFASPRMVSPDVEGNNNYLVSNLTKGFILQWIPSPSAYVNNQTTPTSYTASPGITQYEINIWYNEYMSGYAMGLDDPSSVYSGIPPPSGQRSRYSMLDQASQELVLLS